MPDITKKKYYGSNTELPPAEIIHETISDNEDRVFELEKQLHEQYAINNNSNAGILVTLIGALLVSISGYGYVLYQYFMGECKNVAVLELVALAVIAVMTLLYCICVHFGAGQRMEQFITYAIREVYYDKMELSKNNSNECHHKRKDIFPNSYTPFGKNYMDFVQGIYNIWTKVAIFTIISISSCNLAIRFSTEKYPVILMACLCSVVGCVLFRFYKFQKYKDRIKDYDGGNNKKSHKWYWSIVLFIMISIIIGCMYYTTCTICKKSLSKQLKVELVYDKPLKVQIIN